MSTQPEQRKPFRIPAGKYWNEFYRKWMPDPEQKKAKSK
mgnify:CR=1 FL=1